MKHTILVLLCYLITTYLPAQTLDEIVAANLKNNEATKNVKFMEAIGSGTLESGVKMSVRSIQSNKKCIYQEIRMAMEDSSKLFVKQYCDNKSAWKAIYINGNLVRSDVLLKKEYEELAQYLDITGDFKDYKKRNITLELMPKDSVEGMETVVVKATRPDKSVCIHYFETKNYNEAKSITDRLGGKTQTTLSRDYFMHKLGIMFPRIVESDGMIMNMEYNTDPKIDKKLFEQPK